MLTMVEIVVLLVVLVGASLLVNLARGQAQGREAQRKRQLTSGLRETDAKIAADSQMAKRSMNEAAGQSWRNQFE